MRWWISNRWLAVGLTTGLFFSTPLMLSTPSVAQQPPNPQGQQSTPSQPHQPHHAQTLIQRSQCGNFAVVLGRLRLDNSRYNKMRREDPLPGSETGMEYVSVTADRGVPSLHYLRQTDEARLSIDVTDASQVLIEQVAIAGVRRGERVVYDQPQRGPVSLRLFRDERVIVEHRAASLWHLHADAPEACAQLMSPILDLIIPGTVTHESIRAIDDQLLRVVVQEDAVRMSDVRKQVMLLGSRIRTERCEAQRQIMAMGVAVLPLLESLDEKELDQEQRSRLREIKQKLEPRYPDQPETVARWLSSDYQYWQTAAAKWHARERELASQHLLMACGRELPADLKLSDGKVMTAALK